MNIKQLRDLTEMTQKEFGEYLKIPLRTIQNWESGHRNPPEYVVSLIEYKIKKENENMKRKISKMNLNELMNLDNEVLTQEELAALEEHELTTNFESLGASGQYPGHTWYSVELGEDSIDVYCKFV